MARSKIFPGDVLMNIVGPPLGKVSFVPDSYPQWNTNQAVAIFRPIEGLDPRFLLQLLMTRSILGWAVRRSKATAGQFNLTLEVCRDLPLPLAPLDEQRRIAAITDKMVSTLGHTDSATEAQLRRAVSVRQAILSSAFSGHLVIQNPSDEPASILLERIRAERASAPTKVTRRDKKKAIHA
jgi:type I restriction enzyme, S subunit